MTAAIPENQLRAVTEKLATAHKLPKGIRVPEEVETGSTLGPGMEQHPVLTQNGLPPKSTNSAEQTAKDSKAAKPENTPSAHPALTAQASATAPTPAAPAA